MEKVCVHCGRGKKFHDEQWRFYNYEPELGKPKMSKALSASGKRAMKKSWEEYGF